MPNTLYYYSYVYIHVGNSWSVVISGPEAAATLLRAEGKYPSRGNSVDNMMWIYKNIKKPYPMAFRYVSYKLRYILYSRKILQGPIFVDNN